MEPRGVLVDGGGGRHALAAIVARCARGVRARGVRPGMRVGVWRVGEEALFVVMLALRAVGAVACFGNARWTRAEAVAAFDRVGVAVVLAGVGVVGAFRVPVCAVSWGKGGVRLAGESARSGESCEERGIVFFTSGTTGGAKGVLLDWAAMDVQAAAKVAAVGYSAGSVYAHLAPDFHVGGASSALAVATVGGTHVFVHAAGLLGGGGARLFRALVNAAVDTLVVVPSVLRVLIDAADRKSVPGVRTVLYGGGNVAAALRREVAAVFPDARVVGAYGMTETASSMTFLNHGALSDDSPLHRSAGKPPPHVELRVDAQGPHSVGEVLTRGPHVMQRYVGRGAPPSLEDGWFRTGDIGYVDESSGCLFLVGRAKDMIKTGGENVFAREVEDVLLEHPTVNASAVVGVPHHILGEAVAAVVVPALGVVCDPLDWPDELDTWCREHLSSFKRPRWIVPKTALPTNASGKVLKHIVRDLLSEELARMSKGVPLEASSVSRARL